MPIRRSKHNYLREQERERRRGNGDRNLHYAAWDNNAELARAIIEAGADIEDKDISGATPCTTPHGMIQLRPLVYLSQLEPI